MKSYTIKEIRGNNKEGIIAHFKLLTEYPITSDREVFLAALVKNISDSKNIGYAGFFTKKDLKESLRYNIFDQNEVAGSQSFNISTPELLAVTEKAIGLCHSQVSAPPSHIFLFPTFSNFVRKTMDGVTGYTPYRNTLLIFISPQKTSSWKRTLTETICHEFMHAAMDNHYERKTLLDDLIFEGIAESFVGSLFKTRTHSPSQALSPKRALNWYKKIAKRFKSTDLYYPVFLEGKEYPLWAGYAIGYRIVEAFRKKHPELAWNDIVRLTPQEIHRMSGFGK
ncbi:MAG: hypothetical protein A2878_00570 [Candidatus Moranbacteria bacterium RIFCSPHIGHO2_01_FULL_54_31]|nr:MAG: hypothetical protein A2878_00570 [Candidatus Moranbacteria bacterium RIFCSPHIGHO2_01_FULL_54_31]